MDAGDALLENCPFCGYALTGLSDEHVCPECGQSVDRRWRIYMDAARVPERRRRIVRWLAALGCLLIVASAGMLLAAGRLDASAGAVALCGLLNLAQARFAARPAARSFVAVGPDSLAISRDGRTAERVAAAELHGVRHRVFLNEIMIELAAQPGAHRVVLGSLNFFGSDSAEARRCAAAIEELVRRRPRRDDAIGLLGS